MSSKFALAAALLAVALPAAAQPPASGATPPAQAQGAPPATSAGPQAAIQQAAMAYNQCLSTGAQAVGANVAPEAGATSVMNGCTAQRTALEQAVEALLATLPADQQAAGRAQMQSQLATVPTQIADALRQRNAAATAPAAPSTPATPATPPPH